MKYDIKKNTPLYWYNKSRDLHASAGAIWVAMNTNVSEKIVKELKLGNGFSLSIACHKTFYMLCGLSLELAVKAILVKDYKTIPKTHDLNALISQTNISLSSVQHETLKILTAFIIWGGKYPIPNTHQELNQFNDQSDKYFLSPKKGKEFEIRKVCRSINWQTFNDIWLMVSQSFLDNIESRL